METTNPKSQVLVMLTLEDLYRHLLYSLTSRDKVRAVLRRIENEEVEEVVLTKVEEMKLLLSEEITLDRIRGIAFDEDLWDYFEGEPFPIYVSKGVWTVRDVLGTMRAYFKLGFENKELEQ